MSPTYDDSGSRFQRDLKKLTPAQYMVFRRAVDKLVAALRQGEGFGKGLRVKPVEGHEGVWELTWAPNGRATFAYGKQQRPNEPHVIWRRVGTHDIFRRP